MKRRSLFTMLPAASALLAARSMGQSATVEDASSDRFKIAIQCWTFKEFTLWQAVEMAVSAGVKAIELFPGQRIGGPLEDTKLDPSLTDEEIQTLVEHMTAHGIEPVNFGVTGISKDETEARKTFDFARKLGLYGVTTESLNAIDTLEKLAIEYDVKVCFHNHPKLIGYKMWDPDYVFEQVKDRHENIGICGDLGHWATSGLVPLGVIKKVAPRVRSFHMKDREVIGKASFDCPFGTGIIELLAILDEMKNHNFSGNVSIEYEHNWETSLPEVAQCVGYLRAYSQMRA